MEHAGEPVEILPDRTIANAFARAGAFARLQYPGAPRRCKRIDSRLINIINREVVTEKAAEEVSRNGDPMLPLGGQLGGTIDEVKSHEGAKRDWSRRARICLLGERSCELARLVSCDLPVAMA